MLHTYICTHMHSIHCICTIRRSAVSIYMYMYLCQEKALGEEHDLTDLLQIRHNHDHWSEESLHTLWQLSATGIAGVHRDEDAHPVIQGYLNPFKLQILDVYPRPYCKQYVHTCIRTCTCMHVRIHFLSVIVNNVLVHIIYLYIRTLHDIVHVRTCIKHCSTIITHMKHNLALHYITVHQSHLESLVFVDECILNGLDLR